MKTTIQYLVKKLSDSYPPEEVKAFIRIILENVCGYSYTEQILYREKELTISCREKIYEIAERLKKYEPLQYILGETVFFDLELIVNKSVLIPRPETEELVKWVLDTVNNKESFKIIDIGTGSGCIALALKRYLPYTKVYALDYSENALNVAGRNAEKNNLKVNFILGDVLNWEKIKLSNYDIIISNPPYVRELEKEFMHPNVLNYEPGEALFVPNDKPLLFYERIASLAKRKLKNGGWLFFEINENFGKEVTTILQLLGFKEINVRRDLSGKNRMVRCRR